MSKDSAHYAAARAHAIKRARERYGLSLTAERYRWLCNRIRSQHATIVGVQEDGTEIWVFRWRGRHLLLAYDRGLNAIRTFLPPGSRVEVLVKPTRVA